MMNININDIAVRYTIDGIEKEHTGRGMKISGLSFAKTGTGQRSRSKLKNRSK